jgi:hypothetical protein
LPHHLPLQQVILLLWGVVAGLKVLREELVYQVVQEVVVLIQAVVPLLQGVRVLQVKEMQAVVRLEQVVIKVLAEAAAQGQWV